MTVIGHEWYAFPLCHPLLSRHAYTPQRLFRTKPQKRQAGVTDYAISYTDASDTPYLSMPHVVRISLYLHHLPSHLCHCYVQMQPFPLDYHQTLLSLLDVLSEVYNKISKILGPSPFPSSGQHMMGPLGLLSPHPGVSYLFTGAEAAPTYEGEGSLWGIAHAAGPGTPAALGGGNMMYGGALGSPPPSWNSALGDTVKQIDNKLKVTDGDPQNLVLNADISLAETNSNAPERARRLRTGGNQGRTRVPRSFIAARRCSGGCARTIRVRLSDATPLDLSSGYRLHPRYDDC